MDMYNKILSESIKWIIDNTSLGISGATYLVGCAQLLFIITILFPHSFNLSKIFSTIAGAYIYMLFSYSHFIENEIYIREWLALFFGLLVSVPLLDIPRVTKFSKGNLKL
ncbi:hypothetical protein ACPF04_06415 [Campylobacter sp. MOP51]|uniref:hypothetical protein n=1 Tax=Campylobacter canis TaxID=3378588 RepID=UPI003C4AF416